MKVSGNDFLAATVDQITESSFVAHAIPINWVQSDDFLHMVDLPCQLANPDSNENPLQDGVRATLMHSPAIEVYEKLPSEPLAQSVNEMVSTDLDQGNDSLSLS